MAKIADVLRPFRNVRAVLGTNSILQMLRYSVTGPSIATRLPEPI